MPEFTPHEKNENKKASGAFLHGFGKLLSGIGGLITGVVGVAGLFMAQPDLITVVVPVHTLERVIERAQEGQSQAPAATTVAARAPPAVTPVAATAEPPATVIAPAALGNGVSASLLSLANTPNAFVANVRLTNESAAPVMIAGRRAPAGYAGDFSVSDAFGGACPWQRAPRSDATLGTLTTARGAAPIDPANYKPLAPSQSVTVTLIFDKRQCTSPAQGNQPLTLSGTFVIIENDVARFASASFENVSPAQAN
jgi:hypothetical protein